VLTAEALGLSAATRVLLNDRVYIVQGTQVVRFLQEVPLSALPPEWPLHSPTAARLCRRRSSSGAAAGQGARSTIASSSWYRAYSAPSRRMTSRPVSLGRAARTL
jgi:hypothetical protein